MPRTARAAVGGSCYHLLNRGNDRAQVFHHDGDYHAALGPTSSLRPVGRPRRSESESPDDAEPSLFG